MIVAIEAVGAKFGGAARIAYEASAALAAHSSVEEVVVFASGPDDRAFAYPASVRVVNKPEAEGAAGRLEWLNSGLANAVADAGASVVLALNAVGTVPGVPVVNYYQQPLLYDEAARAKVSGELRTRLTAIRSLTWRAAREAAAHVVQTDWMREQVCAAWNLAADDVLVATPTPPDWADRGKSRTSDLLWVGHELPYKRWPQAQWIHGRWRGFEPEAKLLATLEQATGEGVEALGYLDRADLREHYDKVGALLVTSMTESLGLPLLEAMAAGCPIVAPDMPWARSVCDNAALYWDVENAASAVERLRDARQPAILADLRERMEHRCDQLRDADGWSALANLVARHG